MENIKISVIVPVYKTEKYIRQCVNSIINQTYKNLEIILVDDGSPDNCGKICDEYAENDSRVKVFHKSNGGLVSARKEGVNIATGDYITFVDSDDWIDESVYSHAVNVLKSQNTDVFIFGLNRVSEDYSIYEHENIPEGLYSKDEIYKEITKISNQSYFFKKIFSTVCWNKLFKADIIRTNVINVDNSIKIGEDAALIYPSLLDSDSYYITHSAYYNYRKNNNSIMNSFDNERYKSVAKVLNTIYDAVKKHNLINNEIIMHQLNLYALDLMLITDANYFFDDLSQLYRELKENDRIAIYGKGVYAQNLTLLAKKNDNYIISGCFDSSSVEKLYTMEYDYIIIAVTVSKFVEEMIDTLDRKNIPAEKVLYLSNNDIERIIKEKMIRAYLENGNSLF